MSSMTLLSGFTFIRRAVQLDYPVVESIKSILPIVDEFIVNVGPDDDGTLDLIHSIGDPKIRIIQSQWNPNITAGGYVYAQQTNIALFNCTGKWAFYLQADEVIHEDDLPAIMEYVERYKDDDRVEGLMFREMFFWGDYNVLLNVYPWNVRRRCRLIKPHRFVMSRGDAAGFTVHPKYKESGRRIRVIDTGIRLFHYCSVKSEKALKNKNRDISKYWKMEHQTEVVHDLYNQFPRRFFKSFDDTHPAVMAERMRKHTARLSLSSDQWRKNLHWNERWRMIKSFLVNHITGRFSNKGSYKLLKG